MARYYDIDESVWMVEILFDDYRYAIAKYEFDTSQEAYKFVDTSVSHATMPMSFKVYPKKKESEENLDAETL